MDPSKIPVIQKAIEQLGGTVISGIKGKLGDTCSFGEIRMVMAHLQRMKK